MTVHKEGRSSVFIGVQVDYLRPTYSPCVSEHSTESRVRYLIYALDN